MSYDDRPPVLKLEDMKIVGGLFALRFVPDSDMVELYLEDDENFFLKASFNKSWLNDLRIVAEAGDDMVQYFPQGSEEANG